MSLHVIPQERPFEPARTTNPAPPSRMPPSVPRSAADALARATAESQPAQTTSQQQLQQQQAQSRDASVADVLDSSSMPPRRTGSSTASSQALVRAALLSELTPSSSSSSTSSASLSVSSSVRRSASSHASASGLPHAPDWLRTRGGSLSIAPPGSTLVVTETFLPDSRPLGGFNDAAPAEQEQLLLEDLLFALVGIEGRYIRLVPSHTPRASGGGAGSGGASGVSEDRVSFVASPYIKDASLVESLSRILPLCASYFAIQIYVQVHSRWEAGLVPQAFAAAVRTILKEYLVLVAQLEFQFAQRKLTLLRAWYYLQSSYHSLQKLDQLCQRLTTPTTSSSSSSRALPIVGGAFLNVIHQSLTLAAGDQQTKDLYTHLLVQASVPYFAMLQAWLTQGLLRDAHGEFQIAEHAERSKENVRTDFNDTYWDERYTVRPDKVPVFLAGVSEKILTTGKYLNVIRECARTIPAAGHGGGAILSFTTNERAYLDWVGSAYAHASRLLLDVLLHENDLLGHLRSIKRYFLGAQGDFFVDLMDAAEKELQGKTKDLLITKLRTHLELALRTSRACVDPYMGDLSCQIQPFNLVQQLELIHSISATGGAAAGSATSNAVANAAAMAKRNEFLKGHEAFELSYRVRWPLSLVLSKKTLTKYQLLFRHLFAIKHAERQLNQCWATHQSLKELHLNRKYHHSFGLRHRMLHFFTSMAYYIMVEVLEPNWHQLEQALAQVTTVDQVLRLHHNFLDTCLKQCLLTNQTLLKTIHKVSITALTFAQHADTSINARTPDAFGSGNYAGGGGGSGAHGDAYGAGDSSDDEEQAQRRRAEAEDDFVVNQRRRRQPMNLKQRARNIEDATFAVRQSIQNEEHERFIQDMAEKFDKLLFEFLSALRAKSAFQSTDAHFANLYNRLDYNDWYSTQFANKTNTTTTTTANSGHHAKQPSSY